MEKRKEMPDRKEIDFFYREAITELGRINDRQFARMVNRTVAGSILLVAILYFLAN